MPRHSVERMSRYNIERTRAGAWSILHDDGTESFHSSPESAADRAIELDAQAEYKGIGMEQFASFFDGFEHNGLRAHGTSTWGGGASGDILDQHGDYQGSYAREIDKQTDGSYRVYHDSLKLLPEAQGLGFGTAFFEHSIREYKQHPEIKEVGVTAADLVGGYQWARMGFDFEVDRYAILAASLWVNEPNRRDDLHDNERFARAYAVHDLWLTRYMGTAFAATKLYGNVPDAMWQEFTAKLPTREDMHAYILGDDSALDGKFTSPAEIAMFGRDHRWIEQHDSLSTGVEMWLGKRFLLGAGWRGTLHLE
jgi:GNAT superfamily N-acetyltransferase